MNILRAPIELARRNEINLKTASYRNEFMRDRDRIMYCSGFRRLDGKTQIYLAGNNDHCRNRLTHTLEVAQISRTIAQALELDADLAEAIALGHDLGHAHFGHAGEQMLNRIMVANHRMNIPESPFRNKVGKKKKKKPIYGFKHNVQSVRLATSLEVSNGESGLNLTNYTLWGMMHHSSINSSTCSGMNYYMSLDKFLRIRESSPEQAWSFEAFVVRQADEIAQWHHDLEDALRSHAMSMKEVCSIINEILEVIMSDEDRQHLEKMKEYASKDTYSMRRFISLASKVVVNTLVTRIVRCSNQNLIHLKNKYGISESNRQSFFASKFIYSYDDSVVAMSEDNKEVEDAIGFDVYDEISNGIEKMKGRLERFPELIRTQIHHSIDVERMNAKGQYIIKKLFQAYATHPQQLTNMVIMQFMMDTCGRNQATGSNYITFDSASIVNNGVVRQHFEDYLASSEGNSFIVRAALMRKICDHIASMTDRYAIEEYEKLYG